jgi:alpha-glucosidase
MLNVPRRWGIVIAFLSLLGTAADIAHAVDVDPALLDACPGYNATNVKADGPRLSANLILAGKPCNVFGNDIKVLNLTVVYETGTSTAQYMARQEQRCNF